MIMKTYVIRRRNAWKSAAELEATAARSRKIGDEDMSDQVRWIRSYVVEETDGALGTVCIYQAVSPEAVRDHARRVGMPADEITPVGATVVVRSDPEAAEAAA
jgi:thiamine biosynthesis protein ThiC